MHRMLYFEVDDPASPGTVLHVEKMKSCRCGLVPDVNDEFTFLLPTDHSKVMVVKVDKRSFKRVGNLHSGKGSVSLTLECSVVNTAGDAYKDYTDNV